MPGTRARIPAPEPGRLGRYRFQLVTVFSALGLLGAVAAAPHALTWGRTRIREAPFLLAHVTVRGLARIPGEEIAATLALARGVPLVELDVADLEARLAAHPWVRGATVVRVPPDELRVRIRERRPLAVTLAGRPAVLHDVDETGTAFAPADAEDATRLVAIRLPTPPAVGESDPSLREALRLAASLRRRGLEVPRRVTFGLPANERGAELRLRGFAPAIWIERGEPEPQLDRLALLLAAHVGPANRAHVIDLRFGDRAVLRGDP